MTGERSRVRRRRRWGAVAVAAAAYFLVAVVVDPGQSAGVAPLGPWQDKFQHLVATGTLGLLVARATVDWRHRPVARAAAVLVLAAGWGFVIECAQAPVPYRDFAVTDQVANHVGATLAIAWCAIGPWARARAERSPGDGER